jgi:tetratricopeptide (TPR) repeat protein
MSYRNPVWIIVLALFFARAHAAEPHRPSEAEFNNLPPYCKAKLISRIGSADYRQWEGTLGKDFVHTHHYCFALNFINRYYRSRSAQEKNFNLNSAMNNLDYMITHADPGYSLMPEIYQNRGLVRALMGRHGEAVADMNKAIELNPHQVKAYNVLADHYGSTRQQQKALETIMEGLRYNPDVRSLQRRYTELGGKLPYPEPIQPGPVDASASSPKAEALPPAAPVEAAPAEAPAGIGDAAPTASQEPAKDSKIGSPTNPYCRFCPD